MTENNLREVGSKKVIKIPRRPEYKGAFAKVYFGEFDSKDVAVKKLDESEKNSQAELQHLREFQHENIDTDTDDEALFIVLEKCKCTLKDFINERKYNLPPLEILWGITNGLAYLHENKRVVHRDLKPSNVLMNFQDGRWIPKISDFGISKTIDVNNTKVTQTSVSGTVGFLSPEALGKEKLDQRADIWSLGIIYIYVLTNGKDAFHSDVLKLEYDIREGNVTPNLEGVPEDAKLLVESMTAHNREKRLWIHEVMAHHLFWDGEKKLNFIQELSDMIIAMDGFPKLEEVHEFVGDWRKKLSEESAIVGEVFEKMRHKKQKNGVCDLLRNIRNLKNHYNEKPDEFKECLGTMPDGVIKFFERLFPKLIPYVYETMKPEMEPFNLERFYKFKGSAGLDLGRSPSRPDRPRSGGETDQNYTSLTEERSDTLVLRKYQWELAEPAIAGKNALIIAPTGSGKTAVLTGIIRDRISKTRGGCILFLVPKTALAHQQYEFLKRYLTCSVEKIIGEFAATAPAGQKILDNVVTVMTPQILINELMRKDDDKYITFKNISMLLFDECHNANKKHPFKQILDLFHDARKNTSPAPQIQIVGVTASPGIGKNKDRAKVKANLLELMANLDVTSPPTTVKVNVEELKQHQNEISEMYVKVPTESEFGDEVEKTMAEIEKSVKEVNERNKAQHLNKIPPNRSHQSYEKWTDDLKYHAKVELRDQESGRILITYAEHLKMYNFLMQLKDLVPNAMAHANKMVTFQQEGFENKVLKSKNEALQVKAVNLKVPMLDRLFVIIKEEFAISTDAKCIVFVKRKLTAKSLEEIMSQDPELSKLKPKYLIGTHSDASSEEMTKAVQDNIIKAFRSGETKVIIATSVAEEGIDIKECNLVIMYNYVTGEVGRIQRKGRGRASGSRSILITPVGSDHLRLEQDNIACSNATDQAVEDVTKMSPSDLKNEIHAIQERQLRERKRNYEIKSRQKDSPTNWEILCGKCKNFLTIGSRLRHIEETHVVVQDPEFENRVIKEANEVRKGPHILATANFLCNNPKCRVKVALEMIYKQSSYPTLSIKKILLRKEDGSVLDPKKKSNLPFTVTRSVDDLDESEESNAPGADDSDDSDLNDNNCLETLDMIAK